MPRDFKAQLKAARVIEEHVSKLLRDAGVWVIPSYDWSGPDGDRAPSVLAPKGWDNLVLPDLQGFNKGVQHWIEVKWKWWADYHRRNKQFETGISLRLYEHYRRVEEVTGADVWILFVHHHEAEMRGDSLKRLHGYRREYTGRLMGADGMVFWPYEKIPRWGSLDAFDLPFGTDPLSPPGSPPSASALKPLVNTRPTPLKPLAKTKPLEPQVSWADEVLDPRKYRYDK